MAFNKKQLRRDTKELNKAKAPSKPRDIIYDPAGQWKFPGQNTRIPGGNITMQNVPYPVYAQPNIGQPQMMYPGQDYVFPGADYVDEYPQMKKGGRPRGLVPMPKPSKKGLASKAYSRSLEATNRLFTENKLFEKPKDRRRKVFDPNAKYYTNGGLVRYAPGGWPPGLKLKNPFAVATPYYTNTMTGIKPSAPTSEFGISGQLGKGKKTKLIVEPHIGFAYNTNDKTNIGAGLDLSFKALPNKKKTGFAQIDASGSYNPAIGGGLGFEAGYNYKFGKDRSRRMGEIKPGALAGSVMPYGGGNFYYNPEGTTGGGLIYGVKGGLEYRPKFGNKAPVTFFGKADLNFNPVEGKNQQALSSQTAEFGNSRSTEQDPGLKFKPNVSATIGAKIPLHRIKENLPSWKVIPAVEDTEGEAVYPGDFTYKYLNEDGQFPTNDPEYLKDWETRTQNAQLPFQRENYTIIPEEEDEDYQDGGEYGMPLGTGVSQNFIGNRDEFKVGGIPELPLRDNRVRFNNWVNSFEPKTKMEDGGYIETELTPEEIQAYRDGGYVVEDISIPSLTKAQNGGGLFKRKKKKEQQEQLEYRPPVEVDDEMYESVTPFPEAPEDFKHGVGNIKEIKTTRQAPDWAKFSNEYEKKNSKQAFIDEKKKEYLKNTNQGLIKQAGYNMENFPPDVERRFREAYDYKKNSYIVKKLGKKKGFKPSMRGEWVDQLSEGEKNVVANSKYESKLQPSLWDRTLAGLATIATPWSPELNDAMNKGQLLPGLTKKEQREIKDSKMFGIPTGGLETLAGIDLPGVIAANALEASGSGGYGAGYRESPGVLSAEPMANVQPKHIAALNLINYTAPYDIAAIAPSVIRGLGNTARTIGSVAKTTGKVLTEATPLRNAYKINPRALKENPEMYVYRARPVGQNPDMNMAAQLRAKEAAGEPLNWMQKNIIKMSEGTAPDMGGIAAREKYYGRWFDSDPKNLDYYINPSTRNFADDASIEILRSKLPRAEANKLKVSQFEDAKSLSGFPERELILPKDKINAAEKFPESAWSQLIQEHEAFNTPHWLQGYKKVKTTKGSDKSFMGKVKDYFDRPPGPLMLGMSKGAVFNKEIKNPDYFLDLMKINKYSSKDKKYFEDLIATVKRQGNVASEKQYDELQRLKTGDMNYGKKGYAKGGIVSELSKKKINELVAQGYIVEEVD